MDREAICNEGEVSLGSVDVIEAESSQKRFDLLPQPNCIKSPSKLNIASNSPAGLP